MNSNTVYLRAFEPEDYLTSLPWRNDDRIWSQLGGCKYFVSSAYEKKWIEEAIFDSRNINLAICLKEDDRYIGNVRITNIDNINRSGTSHILIGDRSCWNRGVGAEAYRLLLDYAFNQRGFHRIDALVLEGNTASLKMHQKCGYRIEGTLRESVFKDGHWQNQVHLSILESDFRQAQHA
ncbi:MAG: GNAT family N-acetyltransferase [Bacteroidales bacterium]|nr:GNAT family N-acetyltransferase [Bacteroidales bacterium]